MIGVPRYWRSTTLPVGHVWANGDLALFADWPELKKIYDAGGFAGMLLAYNANSATIAANLGKWRPNAANPTGLYVPKLGDQFFRAWTGTGEAGVWHRDEMRQIKGSLGYLNSWGASIDTPTSALYWNETSSVITQRISGAGRYDIILDSARSVPTGPVTVPPHVWYPVILYLGLPI